ncbi:TIGR01777 family oxidoreductase [Desertivirga brevis]|uniref:TIGR01777 family oxidoreductase n=1 Tax=Desertivirga brevis TaxID=2810310 RepID=UPI001A97703C|nr:TIGR01777 family oxidoreductase [Pedobacter sp. SYSU D00873]
MNKTVLLTGGSGLIGQPLTKALLAKGYTIHHLSRSIKNETGEVKTFQWNIKEGLIDPACIQGVTSIIHLAGEGIGARPWTNRQKREIVESRTESIRLIYKLLRANPNHLVRAVISASGVGFYGNRGDELLTEDSFHGFDFLAHTCVEWEEVVDEIKDLVPRIVKLRTGVVLAEKGGALEQMDKPIKLGLGAALGSGKQWMPWIHINDIVDLYVNVLENDQTNGVYNAASPDVRTNEEFTKAIAKVLNKNLFLPDVPSFGLRIILGEMCALVLNSTKTSSERILKTGFKFTFEKLEDALKDIYARKTTG